MKNNNKRKKNFYNNLKLCFIAYKNREELEKEKNFKNLNKEIKKYKKINLEDINKIIELLKDYTVIEPDVLGEFMEYPIKDKETLKRYFEFYNNYYSSIPTEEIMKKILDIYNKYDYDLSDKINKWFDYWNNKAIKKDIGCLNVEGKIIVKLQKKFRLFCELKDLIKLKTKLKEELCLINKLDFYKNTFKSTIISDIKTLEHLIKLKKNGWIIISYRSRL